MRPSRSECLRPGSGPRGGWCLRIALLLVLLPARELRAQAPDSSAGVPSVQCCLELLHPLGARAVGAGQAVVADTAADMLAYNPAGIVGLKKSFLLVQYRKLPSDAQLMGLSFITRPLRVGSFALSYTLYDEGSLPKIDEYGNQFGETFLQVHVLGATFSTHLAKGLTGGITYKLYAKIAPCGGCATGGAGGATQMIDAGTQFRPARSRWLALGASVVNLGIPLQVVNYEQSDGPPTRSRVGATYEIMHLLQRDTTVTGWLSAQLEMGGADGPVPSIGAQVSISDVVSLRAGWRRAVGATGEVDSGPTLGVGLKLQRFNVGIARSLTPGPLDEAPFQVTFGVGF